MALSQAGWLAGSWPLALLAVAKTIGLVVTGLLLAQSLGHDNPLLQRLCGSGPASSCSAILASPAAKLTADISWAEVGFTYFAGTWLALLTLGDSQGGRLLLLGLSILSLPFTFYSLYYQARVARQWCALCCTVLAVLWIEAGAGAATLAGPLYLPRLAEWATLLGCLLAPVLGWLFVKPYLAQARQADSLRRQLSSFKRNRQLFASALAAQPHHELLPPDKAMQLGNPEAQQVLTVVTSPTCPPCARAHELLAQWLARHDDIQVQLVFAVPDTQQDTRAQMAAHLLALHQQHPPTAETALHNWYTEGQQEYDLWASRYPIPVEALAATPLPYHHAWCRQVGITATPTILLNGWPLPDLYRLEDIRYFL